MKFFIDENMPPNLAEGLAILEKPNSEGVEVYSIMREFGRGILDEDWIPQVAQVDGIVITQDYNIQRTQRQYELLKKYRLGIFYLKSPGKAGYRYWEMVKKVIEHWDEIKESARKSRRPFGYRIMPKGKLEPLSFK